MKNAMDLALLTLQRREDISKMKFEDIKDGYLYVIQEKTKKHDTGYLRIEIGEQLQEVLKRCRTDIPSPFIINRRPQRKFKRIKSKHWTQVLPDMISREFKSIRDSQVGLYENYQEGEKPTFHEIRALGEKLYKDQGKDPKQLGGWASEKMVKNYDSGHS
ncbi:Integrase [Hahella chejuensis KCTC 2396]|uniref:Integrase n=1 Tax=Hahella chejuensis (strain KCTC 2396) TaxID=349521 RepID=Q2SDK0_HAHCH|nr:tyrosine-type recombinase/integrase [Hahella chejuensis]ABC31274.1 Integrase [Hahella chejuensis KCTC 2396]